MADLEAKLEALGQRQTEPTDEAPIVDEDDEPGEAE